MIDSKVSGIAFSLNPLTNNRSEIIIESVLGLGEAVVSGTVSPDRHVVNKKTGAIISKSTELQSQKLVRNDDGQRAYPTPHDLLCVCVFVGKSKNVKSALHLCCLLLL